MNRSENGAVINCLIDRGDEKLSNLIFNKELHFQNNEDCHSDKSKEQPKPVKEETEMKLNPLKTISFEECEINDNQAVWINNGCYACLPCGISFKTKIRLANHIKAHNARQFACFICNRYFSSQKNLKIHLSSRLHTPAARKTYHCGHCQKRFSVKLSFQRHKLKHLMSGCVVKCDKPNCFKKFSRVMDLLMHQKTHRKSYECEKCKRAFSRQYFFDNHRCLEPFVCECKKTFATRQNLNHHAKIHTLGKSLEFAKKSSAVRLNCPRQATRVTVCDVCFKRFRKISDLKNHKAMTHSSVFKCDACDAKFNRKIDLLMHQKTHQKSFPCNECGKVFNNPTCLKRHMFIHEKGTLNCSGCDSVFRRGYLLEKHIAMNHADHKCVDCHKIFDKLQDLVLHSKSHRVLHHAVDDSPGLLGYLN